MRDLLLPQRIRAKAVEAIEVAGWRTLGYDGGTHPVFDPFAALMHHTAGGAFGTAPSLGTIVRGRPDLPPPLAQVLQTREDDYVDKAMVCASGKANHAGVGVWNGTAGTVDGNYDCEGLEVEHTGNGTVHPARLETSCRILAAMIEVNPRSAADMVCQHFEYARPIGRKVDFRELSPMSPQLIRARVAYWVGRPARRPVDPADPFAPADGPEPPPPVVNRAGQLVVIDVI